VDPELREWIERRFSVPEPRSNKVTTIRHAIAEHVRPRDTIHLGMTHARGSVGFFELVRRFAGTDPGFTLCAVQMTSVLAPLVHSGLARKIVTSWAGDSYRTPGPNGVYQRAWSDGLPFEHWSILTFVQRLAAGARGHGVAATRSLVGSTMADENDVRVLDDGTALIPALVPDVSIFHAPAADAAGNVLFSPPLFENVYGALAARRGAIVTVDRVVDTEIIREHAHMTLLPSSRVLAVVEAPMGAHPGGLLPTGIGGVQGYAEDYDFWVQMREAARDPSAMEAWVKEWIVETESHGRYLEMLGRDRIDELKGRTARDPLVDLRAAMPDLDAPPTEIERAICTAARTLGDRIKSERYTAMLAGAGNANLAAWLAAYDLAEDGIGIDLVAEMGLVGYWPRPGEPILFNQRNFPTCTMLADIDRTLSIVIGGPQARSIGALGAAQIDKAGNINSTLVPGEYLLMGSGGANDVVTCATESVVIAAQSKDRFVERVPYVTGPGERVRAVISTGGVFEKDQGELILTGIYDDDVEPVREQCGWDLRVAGNLQRLDPPNDSEIRALRLMDPQGWFRT